MTVLQGRDVIRADDLALLALRCSSAAVREAARDCLLKETHAAKPILDREHIEDLIRACKGTAFAPFSILDESLPIIAGLAQVAISEAHGESRFRIVSEETIGTGGGLTIHRTGKAHYTSPTGLVGYRKSRGLFVAPAAIIPGIALDKLASTASVALTWDGGGYRMAISPSFHHLHLWNRIHGLQRESHFLSPRRTFESRGLRFEKLKNGGLSILTGSPESLLQFTALCSNPVTLVLADGTECSGGASLASFTIPSLDEVPAKLPLHRGRVPLPWARIPIMIQLEENSVLAVAARRTLGQVNFRPMLPQ